ncbi:MAG: FAD-binding protein [Saprospiraceae bacterium]|nr:FAD-binding protein [Bacteroidia bacterium]NNE15309.1 FAD-binding protein [Saprospiraceae bacterium]
MVKEVQLKISPTYINDRSFIGEKIKKKLRLKKDAEFNFKIVKKSIDSRKEPFYLIKILVGFKEEVKSDADLISINYKDSAQGKSVLIIGAGPAGYFAALECIENGLRPIVLERGKDVQARRRDLKAIQQDGIVNPHSNYCFGEGGAGTYSDGKLYTRSKKRGKIIKSLKILVDHGANEDILIDAHPHIGSNKLPKIIANIRKTIEAHGGEVRFGSYVTDFIFNNRICEGVVINDEETVHADKVILATGHSARDIFHALHRHNIHLEAKPFAIGIRIEHPQALIDEIQYGQNPREENLPASSYKLVSQINNVGVFSFCMCPGGLIVPAATAPGEIVVNGMSLSRRDSPFANSGIVTAISNEELNQKGYKGVFANLDFQKEVEQKLFQFGDGSQKAPAQNLIDFINGKEMLALNDTSYIPGLYQAPLHELLPDFVYERLKQGILSFSLKMDGYFTDAANVVATESRTSSPIRIPRNPETLTHDQLDNFYPCGEGAGFAGGILSAAMDGQRVVKAIVKSLA